MTLFTKSSCTNCDYVKDQFDLADLGINIEELGPENSSALAHLAWHELVETARKELPILVLDDCSSIAGVQPICRHLHESGAKPKQLVGLRVFTD